MAYKGGVPVNSGFYPRNDFPIVEAKDIYVSDEQRLDEVLQELAGKQAEAGNADTVDGMHASEFATASDVEQLKILVGDAAVSEQINTALVSVKAENSVLFDHMSNIENPHAITKIQVGLGNVNNTSDANKPISLATQAELDTKQDILVFDNTPIKNSSKPVTSNGIKKALDALNFIDYETYIAFDTSWIVSSTISDNTAILGKAILGKAILGTY